jgi:hypothetical protein
MSRRSFRRSVVASRRRGGGPEGPKGNFPFTTSPRDLSKPVGVHVMSFHLGSDDKTYLLTFRGTVADTAALPSGLTLDKSGETYKVTSTGVHHYWSGTSWVQHGDLTAFTTVGARINHPSSYEIRHHYPPAPARPDTDQKFMGEWRDRFMPVPRAGGTTREFYKRNAMIEVRQMVDAGIDWAGAHLVNLGTTFWPRTTDYLFAAETVEIQDSISFKVCIQPDGTTSGTQSVKNPDGTVNIGASAQALVDKWLTVVDSPALYRIGGKPVMMPFGPELWAADSPHRGDTGLRFTFWSEVKTRAANAGHPIHFAPQFLGSVSGGLGADWDSIVDTYNEWGVRDLNAALGDNNRVRRFTNYIKETFPTRRAMVAIAHGDQRPRNDFWWESEGLDTLEQMWKNAIGTGVSPYLRSDSVSMNTWSDIPEHSHFCPTDANGYGLLLVNRYWLEQWRTGVAPTVTADAIVARHPKHFRFDTAHPLTYTGVAASGMASPVVQQTTFLDNEQYSAGDRRSSALAQNEVNSRIFATAACTVELLVDGAVVETTTIAAGGYHRWAPALRVGVLSMRVMRSGSAVLTLPMGTVSDTQPYQDLYERTYSSYDRALGREPVLAAT